MIYLDYSAHTPADRAVLDAYCRAELTYMANPNSTHAAGKEAAQEMQRATCAIADMLGCLPEEIVYTSGSTESNNLAIKGTAQASRHRGHHIISTALEHASVGATLSALQNQGWEIDLVDIDRSGKIDLEQLRELIRKDTVLVAVSAVDSELGTVQPIAQIAEIVRGYPNCRLHVDATQAVGKTQLVWDGVDTMSIAPHKFYGLNGSGILLRRKDLVLEPQMHGGSSTTIYRSGTPVLSMAVAAEKALSLAFAEYESRLARVQALNEQLRNALKAYPKAEINSPKGAVPHILNLSVVGVKGAAFQQALSEAGVCVSVKSACSVENTPSKAVFAVCRDRKRAQCSWRISLSHLTTESEIEQFLRIFEQCYAALL